MEKEIWQKIGAEADALMLNAAYGRSATPLGISSRLRDMGRYGMLFSPSGTSRNEPVLSEAYIKKIQKGGRPKLFNHNWPDKFEDGSIVHNTYLWDYITKDGDFFKSGHAGQGLYVSPGRDLVIAFFGPRNEDGVENQMPAICRQLVNAGLFDK
jgi:CubicO group peptidase (beta-lactamase class C family)